MGNMHGFKPMEPTRRAYAADILDSLLESGDKCIGKEFDDKLELAKTYDTLRSHIRNHSQRYSGISVSRNGNKLLLILKGADE